MKSSANPEALWLLGEEEDTEFDTVVTDAGEQNRSLADNSAEFKKKYELYSEQYIAMKTRAIVRIGDQFTPEEKKNRIKEAKNIFKFFLNESNGLATLFRFKFRVERALYNRVSDGFHVHGLDDFKITFILLSGSSAYYDRLKMGIKNGDTGPLLLSLYGLYHAWLHFKNARDTYSGPGYLKARGSLALAWVLTENNGLLKSEIESLFKIVTCTGTVADIIRQNEEDIYSVLLKYPPQQRQEITGKLARAQAELKAEFVFGRWQPSVVRDSVFSTSASARQNNDDTAAAAREMQKRK